jgi:hypothetical protein
MDINSLDLYMSCYSHAAYHEASNQSEEVAVMNVIRQRIKAGYGKDSCEVVYADGQFQGVVDETHDEVDMKRFLNIKLLAIDVIHRNRYNNPVPNKLHFYDDSIKTPVGWKNCNIKIGRLVFCD